MKHFALTAGAAAILLFSCNNDAEKKAEPANADSVKPVEQISTKETETHPVMDSAAMAKAWQDFATPGEMHKWMEKTNGTWEGEVSQWMAPDAPPSKSKAMIVQNSLLGGRYVQGKYSGNMMGQPFEGISILGFDNAKKIYTSTWIDNMGTGIVHMSGSFDETTGTLNLKGHQTDPMTGKDSDIREEMKIINDISYSMSMFGSGMDGKEMKFMEAVFNKKK